MVHTGRLAQQVPQREDTISTSYQRYLLSGQIYILCAWEGTERGVLAIQDHVLTLVLTKQGQMCVHI